MPQACGVAGPRDHAPERIQHRHISSHPLALGGIQLWNYRTRRMRRHFLVVMSALLLCVCAQPGAADESARAQMKGLDEQVQEVKTDVLSIAADLNQLEEKLLYPSDTHLAVFVSLAHGEALRLD